MYTDTTEQTDARGKVALRRATPDDIPTLMSLIEAFYEADQHIFDRNRIHRALQPLLHSDEHGIVLLTTTSPGYLVITWGYSLESGGREALIDEFYVSPQGQGFGSAALTALEALLPRYGVRCIFLETERHNERARRLYVRQGFSVDDSIWLSKPIGAP
jgi:ribosomal protein S18 acetylase RimI-like enzyme